MNGSEAASPHDGESVASPTPQINRSRRYEIVDFGQVPGVACPCGTARRAFSELDDYPATLHVTEISSDAKLHYHKRLTETYFFLECEPGAMMQLDDEYIAVRPGMAILIRPGVRHRAIGKMRVLIFVIPKFDPKDEWLDDTGFEHDDETER